MPPQVTRATGFDFNRSIASHAGDKTEEKREIVNLPGGITGGIAQLIEMKFGTYKSGPNKDKRFWLAAGIVVSPAKAVNTVKTWDASLNGGKGAVRVVSSNEMTVMGARTQIMIPLCDTKNSQGEVTTADEHVSQMLNEIRLVGGPECTDGVEDEAGLEELFVTLKEAAPHFRFGTRSGEPTAKYPTPNVFETWYGGRGLENYVPEVPPEMGMRSTPPASANGQSNGTSAKPPAKSPATDPKRMAAQAPEPEEEAPEEVTEEAASEEMVGELPGPNELDELFEAAAGEGDEAADAQQRLLEVGEAIGVDSDTINTAKSWDHVRKLFDAAMPAENDGEEGEAKTADEEPAEEEAVEEEEQSYVPKKGDKVKYQELGKDGKPATFLKNGKKFRKAPVECKVEAVDAKKGTATLKQVKDGKTLYKAVPFEELMTE